MKTYEFNGYVPYGAAEMYCLDMYVEDDFTGNVTEAIINENLGTFEILSDTEARLVMRAYTLDFVRR